VPSNAARLSAVTDTRKVDAALMIDDQLQVVPASRHEEVAVRDDQIEREVRGALHNQADLRGVDATVRGGVARLTGFVSSDRQRLDAATIARSVPGVRAVEDDLRL
jgi:osmotically-inducible protein OsmY